mmetsp:Transcript_6131/g.17917  ORF Transcript_6131/g.17917 Transcript_6131/m.17917 type:complete len:85 (-) Transcript_6131:77-331(-)
MVFGVHAIESYFIFPQIFATKLKLHPLLVLIALYMTEHIVGIKGLFLALPVTVYITNMIFSVDDAAPLLEDDQTKSDAATIGPI